MEYESGREVFHTWERQTGLQKSLSMTWHKYITSLGLDKWNLYGWNVSVLAWEEELEAHFISHSTNITPIEYMHYFSEEYWQRMVGVIYNSTILCLFLGLMSFTQANIVLLLWKANHAYPLYQKCELLTVWWLLEMCTWYIYSQCKNTKSNTHQWRSPEDCNSYPLCSRCLKSRKISNVLCDLNFSHWNQLMTSTLELWKMK